MPTTKPNFRKTRWRISTNSLLIWKFHPRLDLDSSRLWHLILFPSLFCNTLRKCDVFNDCTSISCSEYNTNHSMLWTSKWKFQLKKTSIHNGLNPGPYYDFCITLCLMFVVSGNDGRKYSWVDSSTMVSLWDTRQTPDATHASLTLNDWADEAKL